MKFAGIIGTVIAGLLTGVWAAGRLHRRVTALETLLSLLNELARRLSYTAPPLRDFFLESAAQPMYAGLRFLPMVLAVWKEADFAAAFETAVNTCGKQDGFSAEDIAALVRLGAKLGKSDAQTQRLCLCEEIARLEESRQAVREQAARADKLYLSLGMSGGLALAVLLM